MYLFFSIPNDPFILCKYHILTRLRFALVDFGFSLNFDQTPPCSTVTGNRLFYARIDDRSIAQSLCLRTLDKAPSDERPIVMSRSENGTRITKRKLKPGKKRVHRVSPGLFERCGDDAVDPDVFGFPCPCKHGAWWRRGNARPFLPCTQRVVFRLWLFNTSVPGRFPVHYLIFARIRSSRRSICVIFCGFFFFWGGGQRDF